MVQEVKWTKQAKSDLYDIYRFIARDSTRYAQIQIENIQNAVSNLANFPLMGRNVPEFPHLPYREILVGNYRVLYRLEGEKGQIIIMSVVHGRRLLKELKERDTIRFRFITDNPWLSGIIGGIIIGILVFIGTYYLKNYLENKASRARYIALIDKADSLLMNNLTKDALNEYTNLLNEGFVVEHPEFYAHIRASEGICYLDLYKEEELTRTISFKERREILKKAIHAFEEALKFYTAEKYPSDYEAIMSNMKKAEQEM